MPDKSKPKLGISHARRAAPLNADAIGMAHELGNSPQSNITNGPSKRKTLALPWNPGQHRTPKTQRK